MYAAQQRVLLVLSLFDGVVVGFYNEHMTFRLYMNDDHCPRITNL